eukprot:14203647-Alexandrium_andersonii.AAC.1
MPRQKERSGHAPRPGTTESSNGAAREASPVRAQGSEPVEHLDLRTDLMANRVRPLGCALFRCCAHLCQAC